MADSDSVKINIRCSRWRDDNVIFVNIDNNGLKTERSFISHHYSTAVAQLFNTSLIQQ